MSTTLRSYLSHDWQDISQVSRAIYDDMGIAIKPDRLGRLLSDHYPDVVVSDGILIRIQPQPTETSDAQPSSSPSNKRRRA
jgi:hypothetical protein